MREQRGHDKYQQRFFSVSSARRSPLASATHRAAACGRPIAATGGKACCGTAVAIVENTGTQAFGLLVVGGWCSVRVVSAVCVCVMETLFAIVNIPVTQCNGVRVCM